MALKKDIKQYWKFQRRIAEVNSSNNSIKNKWKFQYLVLVWWPHPTTASHSKKKILYKWKRHKESTERVRGSHLGGSRWRTVQKDTKLFWRFPRTKVLWDQNAPSHKPHHKQRKSLENQQTGHDLSRRLSPRSLWRIFEWYWKNAHSYSLSFPSESFAWTYFLGLNYPKIPWILLHFCW